MTRRWSAESDDAEGLLPDLTPMLDVLFMLLVFFLLTANSAEHALEILLPDRETAAARPVDDTDALRVVLPAGDRRWVVNGARYAEWEAAKAAILAARAADREVPAIIEGDRDVPLERVVEVMGFLAANGFSAVNVLVDPRQAGGEPN
jgi:biopolymer transport protein ExbD